MTTPAIYVGAAATAVANNTLLPAGAIGVTNEGGVKIGPGLWNDLPYLASKRDLEVIRQLAQAAMDAVTGLLPASSVPSAPVIVTQPVAQQSVTAPATVTFSVVATGAGLQYQWQKNGQQISGATGSSYTTPPTTTADNFAVFFCVITNGVGGVISEHAQIFVAAAAPAPAPDPAPVTVAAALLTLATPDNPSFRNGDRAVSTLAAGITASFAFTRERNRIAGVIGSGNSATYVRADRAGVPATLTPALSATADPAALANFVGAGTVGSTVTLSVAVGITGELAIFPAANPSNWIPAEVKAVAAGTNVQSISYIVQPGDALPLRATVSNVLASDADKVIAAEATDLTFTAALTAARDDGATLSFFGSGAVGSTVTASFGANTVGSIQILRANGSVVATAASAPTLQYTVQAGDAPLTAIGSGLIYTVVVSKTAGAAPSPSDFLSVEYEAAVIGGSVGAGDIYKARLPPGVTGVHTWYVAGVEQKVSRYPAGFITGHEHDSVNYVDPTLPALLDPANQLNASSFQTPNPGDGPVAVAVSRMTFASNGVYAVAPAQDASGPPFLYSIEILAANRTQVRLGYMPLADLDTSHVPQPSDYAFAGTFAQPKAITAVEVDNSASDLKYVLLTLSTPLDPGDRPLLSYSGTALRYPGGQPAAAFSTLTPFTDIPQPMPLVWKAGETDQVNAGEIFGYEYANAVVLVANKGDFRDYRSSQECAVQMSILPDWGKDNGIFRVLAMHVRNNSDAFSDLSYQVRRNGNTVSMVEHQYGGSDVDYGPAYTFANPGPLCLVKLRRTNPSKLVQMETTEDGGVTWIVRYVGTLVTEGLSPRVASNRADVPVTGVGFVGFTG